MDYNPIHIRNVGFLSNPDPNIASSKRKWVALCAWGELSSDWAGKSRLAESVSYQLGEESYRVNLLEITSPYPSAHRNRQLEAVEGVVFVQDATGSHRKMAIQWNELRRHGRPAVLFVDGFNRPGVNLFDIAEQAGVLTEARPIPLQYPIGEGEGFQGYVDLMTLRAYTCDRCMVGYAERQMPYRWPAQREIPIPEAIRADVEAWRDRMVESIVELDELLVRYLEAPQSITVEELRRSLRQSTLALTAVPMIGGEADCCRGIEPLLECIISYLPSPADRGTITGVTPGEAVEYSTPISLPTTTDAPLVALAFSGSSLFGSLDKERMVRVYSGRLRAEQRVHSSQMGRAVRIVSLYRIQQADFVPVEMLEAGDIGLLLMERAIDVGDTLCSQDSPIDVDWYTIKCPPPLLRQIIHSNSAKTLKEITDCLGPAAVVRGESITLELAGHVDMSYVQALQYRFPEATITWPQIIYRTTVVAPITHRGVYALRVKRHRQSAELALEFGPTDGGKPGLEFSHEIPTEAISPATLTRIRRGLEASMEQTEVLAGQTLYGLKVVLKEATFHPSAPSREDIQRIMGECFQEACNKAQLVLHQPIMDFTIEMEKSVVEPVLALLEDCQAGAVHLREAHRDVTVVKGTLRAGKIDTFRSRLHWIQSGHLRFTLDFALHFASYVPIAPGDVESILGE